MYSRVNEKLIYVIDITFGVNESVFSDNEQQKVFMVAVSWVLYFALDQRGCGGQVHDI